MARGKKGKKVATAACQESDNEEDTHDFLAALQQASNEDHDSKIEEGDMEGKPEVDEEENGNNSCKKSEKKLPKKVLEAQRQAAAAEEAKRDKEKEKSAEEAKVSNHDDDHQSGDDSDGSASYNTSDDDDDDMPMTYPVKVLYCPHCTFPVEMCEYGGMYEEKCKEWLTRQAEDGVREARRALKAGTDVLSKGRKRKVLTDEERRHNILSKGGRKEVNKEVHFTVVHRVGKKYITQIKGLDLFGFVMKDVCKDLKKVLSTGASVTEHAGSSMAIIEVQGDVVEQVVNILSKKMNVPKDKLFLVDKDKKTCLGDANMVMLSTKPKKKEVVKKEPIICPQQNPDFETGNQVKKEAIVVEVYESDDEEAPEQVKKVVKSAPRRSGPSKRGTKNLL